MNSALARSLGHTKSAVQCLGAEFWGSLRQESRKQTSTWTEYPWWHNKYYFRTAVNDGDKPKKGLRGEIEIPDQRGLFYPSNGRFALSSGSVAYFSYDFGTNCLETIAQFRDGTLAIDDLVPYFQGSVDPDPHYYGYPLTIRLAVDILLLDLTDGASPLIQALQRGWDGDYNDDVLMNPSKDVYETTHVISDTAQANGFDGIAYNSVRVPDHLTSTGLILPKQNLVIFDESKIANR